MRPFFLGVAFAATSLIAQPLRAAEPGPGLWTPQRVERAPRVDGDLDDEAWSAAVALSDFRQVEPIEGSAPSETTEVRIVFDTKRLYFAVRARDRRPGEIVATQRRRDADLADDDHVILVFDPFFDQRNGYLFAFNALGAQRDALIEQGRLLNPNWDGIWDVAVQRTADGWQAEGSIPFATISFNPATDLWGFNVERRIAGRAERVRWHGSSRQYEVNSLAEAGRLTGLTGLQRGLGLELRPYVAATRTHEDRRTDNTRFKPGADISYRITDSSTAVLTVNTDFADAEVDDRRVNLTRFPISFPEKRAFFLQDAGIFSFSLINSSPIPFTSRRIGIGAAGEQVDLEAGLRVSGREGPVSYGLLGVRTDASGSIGPKDLGVARMRVNVMEESDVGVIATFGDPLSNGDAQLVGTDFTYRSARFLGRPSTTFEGSLWYQHTDATARERDSHAFGYEFTYDSPTWGATSYIDRVGPDYYPALGFVTQSGIWQNTTRIDREFRPAGLKRIVPGIWSNYRVRLDDGRREFQFVGPEVTFETRRGDSLVLRAREERERLTREFKAGPGVAVRPGSFEGTYLEATLTLTKSRPLAPSLSVIRKPYYGGEQLSYKGTLTWRPSPMFNVDGGYEYTGVDLGYARFPVRLARLASAVQFSPRLVWASLAQYDNLSRSVGINTRLRWTYASGGDLFVVLNQGVDTTDDRWELTRTELSSKIGASFRF